MNIERQFYRLTLYCMKSVSYVMLKVTYTQKKLKEKNENNLLVNILVAVFFIVSIILSLFYVLYLYVNKDNIIFSYIGEF